MASRFSESGWYHPTLYLVFCLVILFFQLLPLSPGYAGLPAPDLLLCLTFAWVIRQPDRLPVGMIVGLFFIADFLLQRPPGLWTAIVLIAVEFLKSRIITTREISWVVEWFTTATVMVAAVLLNRAFLAMFIVPLPSFSLEALLLLFNVMAYPLVMLFLRYAVGLEREVSKDNAIQKAKS